MIVTLFTLNVTHYRKWDLIKNMVENMYLKNIGKGFKDDTRRVVDILFKSNKKIFIISENH